jgi:hypothetical protein
VKELSSYVFSPLREGDIALYRGSGNSGSQQRYRAAPRCLISRGFLGGLLTPGPCARGDACHRVGICNPSQ